LERQVEEYAGYLYVRPTTGIEDIAAVVMMPDIEPTKSRKNAAPTPHLVRSVALGLLGGYGNPVDARVNSHYEGTIRLLSRDMRQAVVGYDGDPVFGRRNFPTKGLNSF
jgi:hypothetical protein